MTLRFGKPLFIYFCCAMMALVLTMSGGIYYYWNEGPANIEHVGQVFESTIQLDSLEKRGGVKKIRDLIRSDRAREAITYFDAFQSKVSSLNKLENISEYEKLSSDFNSLKKALNSMLSFSSKTRLINVLRKKVSNFEIFVVKNGWRTLSRVSKKIKAKISNSEIRNPSFFSFKKMNSLRRSIAGDIDYMENVTKGSVLSSVDKNLILIKLGSLNKEMKMLKKSISSLRLFYSTYLKVKTSYKAWLGAIAPTMALKKIEVVKNSQIILYGMIGSLTLVVFLFFGGILAYSKGDAGQRRDAEREFLDVIKDGLIPVQANLKSTWSQNFKEEIDKYREYMHKRMSFGSIFQDAMPFSSILLDSNLNLVWANSLFYEHWNLSRKVKNDSNVTWDFLQRFTNLGENDPVLCAVKENIAGIYQIQVKTENSDEAAPFEMYVSPVEYAGQKRIMVIFYPLRSLEETLGSQMKSLVSPVTRTLDSLIDDEFNGEFRERIKADFEAAGIEGIFSKFDKVNNFFTSQRDSLHGEIEAIEGTLYEQCKVVEDVKIVTESQKDLQKEAINKFGSAKDHIISIVDLRSQFELMLGQMNEFGNELFAEEVSLLSKSSDINEQMSDNAKALESLVHSRDEFKKLKSQVDLYRSRVSQMLDNSRNTDWGAIKNVQGLHRLKTELTEFETILSAFSRVSTSLDVGLSKIQIIMQGKEMPNLVESKSTFEALRTKMEDISIEANKLSRIGQCKDEELIKSLKGLYLSFQNIRSKSVELDKMFFVENHEVSLERENHPGA